jgi:hypothetical protein
VSDARRQLLGPIEGSTGLGQQLDPSDVVDRIFVHHVSPEPLAVLAELPWRWRDGGREPVEAGPTTVSGGFFVVMVRGYHNPRLKAPDREYPVPTLRQVNARDLGLELERLYRETSR